ncbi:hypothetical protein H9P43_002059 [Blastocladiella emersonii ATCC 22665]|nr:hypothetical protein H9P43_002059 [Blastocladiella emersonii ATCC 22665]
MNSFSSAASDFDPALMASFAAAMDGSSMPSTSTIAPAAEPYPPAPTTSSSEGIPPMPTVMDDGSALNAWFELLIGSPPPAADPSALDLGLFAEAAGGAAAPSLPTSPASRLLPLDLDAFSLHAALAKASISVNTPPSATADCFSPTVATSGMAAAMAVPQQYQPAPWEYGGPASAGAGANFSAACMDMASFLGTSAPSAAVPLASSAPSAWNPSAPAQPLQDQMAAPQQPLAAAPATSHLPNSLPAHVFDWASPPSPPTTPELSYALSKGGAAAAAAKQHEYQRSAAMPVPVVVPSQPAASSAASSSSMYLPFAMPQGGAAGMAASAPAATTLSMGLPSPQLGLGVGHAGAGAAQAYSNAYPVLGGRSVSPNARPFQAQAAAGAAAAPAVAAILPPGSGNGSSLPPTPTTPTMPLSPGITAFGFPTLAPGAKPPTKLPPRRRVPSALSSGALVGFHPYSSSTSPSQPNNQPQSPKSPRVPTSPSNLSLGLTVIEHGEGDSAIKLFACTECDKTFRRKADCVRHARVHTGEKPYQCSCGDRYARQDALRRHQGKAGNKCAAAAALGDRARAVNSLAESPAAVSLVRSMESDAASAAAAAAGATGADGAAVAL